jgi:small-conductance mechanosensitive channel
VVTPSLVAVPVGERGGDDEVAAVLRGIIPSTPEHRFGGTLLIGFFLLVMVAAARGLVYARRWLRPVGLLPRVAAFSQTAARAFAVLALLALVAIWLPGFLHPAVPWVILAAALALGWSARELLPDLVAGATIAIERRLRVGQWVRGPGWEGEIVALGARAATLRDPQGRTTLVPNRLVLSAPALVDDARWPAVEIAVHIDARHPADAVRRALLDAALLSPLTPPAPDATVARDPRDPALWRVRLRVREARFARDVEADVAERAAEILGEPPR